MTTDVGSEKACYLLCRSTYDAICWQKFSMKWLTLNKSLRFCQFNTYTKPVWLVRGMQSINHAVAYIYGNLSRSWKDRLAVKYCDRTTENQNSGTKKRQALPCSGIVNTFPWQWVNTQKWCFLCSPSQGYVVKTTRSRQTVKCHESRGT
jgi:hypothetical protein